MTLILLIHSNDDYRFKAMGIEVIDLRPDIFQMVCGYFSLFINHMYFQQASDMIYCNLWAWRVYT